HVGPVRKLQQPAAGLRVDEVDDGEVVSAAVDARGGVLVVNPQIQSQVVTHAAFSSRCAMRRSQMARNSAPMCAQSKRGSAARARAFSLYPSATARCS